MDVAHLTPVSILPAADEPRLHDPSQWSFPAFFVFLCVDCTITETIEGRARPQAIEHCGPSSLTDPLRSDILPNLAREGSEALAAAAQAQQPAPPPFATTKVEGTENVYIFG